MKTENILLVLIAIAFLGFIIGLAGKNITKPNRKTFKKDGVYNYLMAVSVIFMLTLAIIYHFMTF